MRPFYRAGDLAGLEPSDRSQPGQFPYVRGSGRPTFETADSHRRRRDSGGPASRRWRNDGSGTGFRARRGRRTHGGSNRRRASAPTRPRRPLRSSFAVGSTFFLEIAKLRAARLRGRRWRRPSAYWIRPRPGCDQSVRTARANKSVYDPYTNLLRATTEAMSACIGGCDALTVEPFGFDPHLAENVAAHPHRGEPRHGCGRRIPREGRTTSRC